MDLLPWWRWYSWSLTEVSLVERPKTSRKWVMKLLNVWVTGPDCDQIVSAHWRALPVNREITKAILDFSVGYICGCISRASEHCKRNPLHSSATPEKGAGLAMGLAIKGAEEVVVLVPEVIGGAGGGVGTRTRRRLSTSSWKGSGLLMLSSVRVRSSVIEAELTQRVSTTMGVYWTAK